MVISWTKNWLTTYTQTNWQSHTWRQARCLKILIPFLTITILDTSVPFVLYQQISAFCPHLHRITPGPCQRVTEDTPYQFHTNNSVKWFQFSSYIIYLTHIHFYQIYLTNRNIFTSLLHQSDELFFKIQGLKFWKNNSFIHSFSESVGQLVSPSVCQVIQSGNSVNKSVSQLVRQSSLQ